jgi:Mce-associated membrane protein
MTTPSEDATSAASTVADSQSAHSATQPRARFAATPSTILAGSSTPVVPVPRDRPSPPRRHAEPPPASAPGRSRGPIVAVVAVTLAVAVAVVLAIVVTGLSNRGGGQSSSATTDALEKAASNGTQAALSYNYQHLSADFAAAEKFMTPSFAANYKKTTATQVQALAAKYHAVSAATVLGAGVDSATGSHATVLVFVDQTAKNTQLSAPRLDRSRIEVSLVRSGNKWLISQLSPI